MSYETLKMNSSNKPPVPLKAHWSRYNKRSPQTFITLRAHKDITHAKNY